MRQKAGLALLIALIVALVIPVKAAIVFSDDFNRDNGLLGSSWDVIRGTWSIESYEASESTNLGRTRAIIAGASWSDFVLRASVKTIEGLGAMVLFRIVDNRNYYEALLREDIDYAAISRLVDGQVQWIGWSSFASASEVWYDLRVEAFGSSLKMYVDNTLVVEATDSTFTEGTAGIGIITGHAHFDDVTIDNPGDPPPPQRNGVPEPAAAFLIAAGFGAYWLLRRKGRLTPK